MHPSLLSRVLGELAGWAAITRLRSQAILTESCLHAERLPESVNQFIGPDPNLVYQLAFSALLASSIQILHV